MAFDKYVIPTMPIPGREYDQRFFVQLARSLQNLFDILNSNAAFNAAIVTPTMLRTPITPVTVADGNNDALALPPHTFLRIVGPTAAFDIRGINSNPQVSNDGRQIILYNPTAHKMTIHDEEAAVTAENRIRTGTGANVNISGTGSAYMIYSVKDLRWLVIAHSG